MKQHKVEGLLSDESVREVQRKESYIGKGRGSKKRPKKVTEYVRYQVTAVLREHDKIEEKKRTYGWKAYVTDVPEARLDFLAVQKLYRKQYRIELIFKRLKSRLKISAFYVKRDDQDKGNDSPADVSSESLYVDSVCGSAFVKPESRHTCWALPGESQQGYGESHV